MLTPLYKQEIDLLLTEGVWKVQGLLWQCLLHEDNVKVKNSLKVSTGYLKGRGEGIYYHREDLTSQVIKGEDGDLTIYDFEGVGFDGFMKSKNPLLIVSLFNTGLDDDILRCLELQGREFRPGAVNPGHFAYFEYTPLTGERRTIHKGLFRIEKTPEGKFERVYVNDYSIVPAVSLEETVKG